VRAPRPPFMETETEPTSPMQLVAGHSKEKATR
jgi:hypothetical protein